MISGRGFTGVLTQTGQSCASAVLGGLVKKPRCEAEG